MSFKRLACDFSPLDNDETGLTFSSDLDSVSIAKDFDRESDLYCGLGSLSVIYPKFLGRTIVDRRFDEFSLNWLFCSISSSRF